MYIISWKAAVETTLIFRLLPTNREPPTTDAADRANQGLVDRLIAEGALWSPTVIAAFRATPRHRFLDHVFQYQSPDDRWRKVATADPGPEEVALLYSDRALITRLGSHGPGDAETPISSSSQPSLMAQMIEELHLARGQKVLEVGAGTGYNAALMAHIVGPDRVYTVDVDRVVLTEAWEHLEAFSDCRVHVRHADGRAGLPEAAPFDRIVVTAATPDLEPAWLDQLAEGGVLQAPLTIAPGLAYIVRGTVQAGTFDGRLTRAAYFMALRAEGETGGGDTTEPIVCSADQAIPAPWAGWFDRRRPRANWLRFSQALAFYGWLRGLVIHSRPGSGGLMVFSVSDPIDKALCWLDRHEWQVDGRRGRELGSSLWQAFLAAGGPWPTEFRVRARAMGPLTLLGAREEYAIQGCRCQQVWELIEPRDRPSAW